jgi:hypothetical protein
MECVGWLRANCRRYEASREHTGNDKLRDDGGGLAKHVRRAQRAVPYENGDKFKGEEKLRDNGESIAKHVRRVRRGGLCPYEGKPARGRRGNSTGCLFRDRGNRRG